MSQHTLDSIAVLFEEFKNKNDERLKAIEAKGHDPAEINAHLERLNGEIGKLQDKLTEEQKAAKARIDELETVLNRPGATGEGVKDEAKLARQFFAAIQGQPENLVKADVEAYRGYKSAFANYLRKGEHAAIQNAMSVGSDPNGGYFVPADTSGRIVQLIYETSPIRQLANVVTIGTDALEGPYDLGDVGSGWVGETQSRAETTTPGVGTYRIPVNESYAEPRVTQKLLDDASVDIEGWLSGKIADRLARIENTAFVNGTGINQPRGFLTYTAGTPSASTFNVIQQVNTGANGAFAASTPGHKLIDLVFSLKSTYRTGAVWMMSRATLGEVRKLVDGQNNYLWQPDFTQRQGGDLLGYPVVEAEDMPAIATNSLSIAFGNFGLAYQIVDRQGIRTLRDPYTAKPYVKFYTTKRVGGDVVNFEAIKLLKFST